MINMDNDNRNRAALLRKTRPMRGPYPVGSYVYFRKNQKRPGEFRDMSQRWCGPARVVGHDGEHGGSSHAVYLRYQTQTVLISPEQLRPASEDELTCWDTISPESQQHMDRPGPNVCVDLHGEATSSTTTLPTTTTPPTALRPPSQPSRPPPATHIPPATPGTAQEPSPTTLHPESEQLPPAQDPTTTTTTTTPPHGTFDQDVEDLLNPTIPTVPTNATDLPVPDDEEFETARDEPGPSDQDGPERRQGPLPSQEATTTPTIDID